MNNNKIRLDPQRQHEVGKLFKPILSILWILALIIAQLGCTRSLQQDGAKVAQVGSTTAKQMAEYYTMLQKDIVDTYELSSFREAYLLEEAYKKDIEQAKRNGRQSSPQTSDSLSDIDKQILK